MIAVAAYAMVTFEKKAAADKACGSLSKTYLFPEIRGRRTRITRLTETGTAEMDSDDELLAEEGTTMNNSIQSSQSSQVPEKKHIVFVIS